MSWHWKSLKVQIARFLVESQILQPRDLLGEVEFYVFRLKDNKPQSICVLKLYNANYTNYVSRGPPCRLGKDYCVWGIEKVSIEHIRNSLFTRDPTQAAG